MLEKDRKEQRRKDEMAFEERELIGRKGGRTGLIQEDETMVDESSASGDDSMDMKEHSKRDDPRARVARGEEEE